MGSAATFEAARPVLLRTAYRMLGSLADAEDVVQDAWLRWSGIEEAEVEKPGAFLRRTVVRLCLDILKSARVKREQYVGPWLPDPIVEDEPVEDVTLPLLLALERLSPLERAAFLLHDVFGESFDEIAQTLGRDSAACRQLASRARQNLRADKPRYTVSREQGLTIASAFFAASRSGDVDALGKLLASDVSFQSDGGGKRPALPRVITGAEEVAGLLSAIASFLRGKPARLVRYTYINGLPGFVTQEADGPQTTALLIDQGRIKAIYVMRNPDKLRHLEGSIN
ncbi:MAG TPA: sigma-70 family RNA polymerase sigma factor [Sphingomicrobium sp.]